MFFRKMEHARKCRFRSGLALVLAALGLGTATLAAATFTASLDRDTIALGETATLTLRFEGGQPKLVRVDPAGAPDIDASGVFTETSTTTVTAPSVPHKQK